MDKRRAQVPFDAHAFEKQSREGQALSMSETFESIHSLNHCLVHFGFEDIRRALSNIRASRVKYLLATTFPACQSNEDIVTGDWRPLNLQIAPLHFPPPLRMLREGCTEGGGLFEDKSLGLWLVRDLPAWKRRCGSETAPANTCRRLLF